MGLARQSYYYSPMTTTILIIGGGQAAAQAVDTLRRAGFDGRLVLVGDEPHLPYQRPPCRSSFWRASWRSTGCRSGTRRSTTGTRWSSGWGRPPHGSIGHTPGRSRDGTEIAYDRLMLSTGAHSRALTCPGAELSGVHYLRGIGDVALIREGLKPAHAW